MRQLMPYQEKAIEFIRSRRGRAGLFLDPGTGKTLTAIRYAPEVRGKKLVICRPDDFLTWEDELLTEGYQSADILFIRSSLQELPRVAPEWTFITYDLTKADVLIRWLHSQLGSVTLSILDESHQIKRWEAERTRTVVRLTAGIPHRLALTGTPITNEVMDVFSQALYIDGGQTFGRAPWPFKRKYYVRDPMGSGWYPRRGAKKEIQQKLERIAFHVNAEDVLTFPNTYHYRIYCPMTGIQRRLYDSLLEGWEYETRDGETIELNYIIAQVAKLKQVASGTLRDPDGKRRYFRNGKLTKLREMVTTGKLKDLKKGVIWCSQTAEIYAVSRMLSKEGIEHVRFFGEEAKNKKRARQTFRDSRKCRFFVGQVESGVGMNELVVANTAIYYSNSRKVVARQQSMRRTKRKGSERHRRLEFYDLITEGSIDRFILRSVLNSMDVAAEILKGLKKGRTLESLLR